MNSLFISNIVVYASLIAIVLIVTKENNFWGVKKGTSNTKVDVKKAKVEANYRNMLLKWLKFFDNIGRNVGFVPSVVRVEAYEYNIYRGRLLLPYVERNITPYELIGIFKLVKYTCCFLGTLLTLITGNRIFLILWVSLIIDKIFEFSVEQKIIQEDKEIEEDFPDLYMLLYSRLLRGTSTRLAPTLDEYIMSVETIYGEKSHKAMHNFVMDLRKNIEVYGDDSLAIHQLRGKYKSAMLVNFFNLAVQALRGVDNKDKLLAFKMELSQKRLDRMTEKANAMVEKGQKVVMLIFIILGQFIVLSWVAKAGLSFMMLR